MSYKNTEYCHFPAANRHFPVAEFSSTGIFQYWHFPELAFSELAFPSTGIFQRPTKATAA